MEGFVPKRKTRHVKIHRRETFSLQIVSYIQVNGSIGKIEKVHSLHVYVIKFI